LIDMKVEPFLIASTVSAIISQRLVRRICPERDKYSLSSEEAKSLSKQIDLNNIVGMLGREKIIDPKITPEKIEWARPKKSEECKDGYKGRLGIHEVLEMSETIRQMIVKSATSDEIEKQARAEGMLTMLEEGFIRAAQRVTSIEEILRVTSE